MDMYLEWGFMGREMAFEEGLLLSMKTHKIENGKMRIDK